MFEVCLRGSIMGFQWSTSRYMACSQGQIHEEFPYIFLNLSYYVLYFSQFPQ